MSFFRTIFRNLLISSALLSSQTNRFLFFGSNKLIKTMSTETRSGSASESLTPYSIAYVTAPNGDVAKDIAQKLVETKLCGCVNIIPSITSVYEWKGKIETDSEVLMIIKTRTDLIDKLTEQIKAKHPYEVFELISTPIQNGNPDYLKWLGGVMSSNK